MLFRDTEDHRLLAVLLGLYFIIQPITSAPTYDSTRQSSISTEFESTIKSFSTSRGSDDIKEQTSESGTRDDVITTTSATAEIGVDMPNISAEFVIGIDETVNNTETTSTTSYNDYTDGSGEERNDTSTDNDTTEKASTQEIERSTIKTSTMLSTNDKITTMEPDPSTNINIAEVANNSLGYNGTAATYSSPVIGDNTTTSENSELTTERYSTINETTTELTNASAVNKSDTENSSSSAMHNSTMISTGNDSISTTSVTTDVDVDISDISSESATGVNKTVNYNETIWKTSYQETTITDRNEETRNHFDTDIVTPVKPSTPKIERSVMTTSATLETNNEMTTTERGITTIKNTKEVTNASSVNKSYVEKSSTPMMKSSTTISTVYTTNEELTTREPGASMAINITEETIATDITDISVVNNYTIEKQSSPVMESISMAPTDLKTSVLLTTNDQKTTTEIGQITITGNATEVTNTSVINSVDTEKYSSPVMEVSSVTPTDIAITRGITAKQSSESGSGDDVGMTIDDVTISKGLDRNDEATTTDQDSTITYNVTNIIKSTITASADIATYGDLLTTDTLSTTTDDITETSESPDDDDAISQGGTENSSFWDPLKYVGWKVIKFLFVSNNDTDSTIGSGANSSILTTIYTPTLTAASPTTMYENKQTAKRNTEFNNLTKLTSTTVPSNTVKTTYGESTSVGSRASWISSSNLFLALSHVLAVHIFFRQDLGTLGFVQY